MKSINWGNISASSDGGTFYRLPAGPYVAEIVSMEDKPEREYVEVVFDIAEGEHKGHFSDDWGKRHPYAHHFFLSYRDGALSMLKGRLEAIQGSNPGFDAFAAWDAGRLDIFAGRKVGVNLQDVEYARQDGSTGMRCDVCQVVPAQNVRDGKVVARPAKLLESVAQKITVATAGGTADASYLPF